MIERREEKKRRRKKRKHNKIDRIERSLLKHETMQFITALSMRVSFIFILSFFLFMSIHLFMKMIPLYDGEHGRMFRRQNVVKKLFLLFFQQSFKKYTHTPTIFSFFLFLTLERLQLHGNRLFNCKAGPSFCFCIHF